jgi:hypothetical protein
MGAVTTVIGAAFAAGASTTVWRFAEPRRVTGSDAADVEPEGVALDDSDNVDAVCVAEAAGAARSAPSARLEAELESDAAAAAAVATSCGARAGPGIGAVAWWADVRDVAVDETASAAGEAGSDASEVGA